MITDRLAVNGPHNSNEFNSSWSFWNLILCTVHPSSRVSSFCVPKDIQIDSEQHWKNVGGSRSPSKCPSIERFLVNDLCDTVNAAHRVMFELTEFCLCGRGADRNWPVHDLEAEDPLLVHLLECLMNLPVKACKKLHVFWSDQMTSNRSKVMFA